MIDLSGGVIADIVRMVSPGGWERIDGASTLAARFILLQCPNALHTYGVYGISLIILEISYLSLKDDVLVSSIHV